MFLVTQLLPSAHVDERARHLSTQVNGEACGNHVSVGQGFLAPGTDIRPIVPALEKIWADSLGKGMAEFNFRSVTSKFNELVFQYPIRIPERYALVIRCHTVRLLCLCYQKDTMPFLLKAGLLCSAKALALLLLELRDWHQRCYGPRDRAARRPQCGILAKQSSWPCKTQRF